MAQTEQDGPLFLVVTIFPKLDQMAEAAAQLKSMVANNLQEEGCVSMHLVQSEDEPEAWMMLEHFSSRAAWDEHMASDHNKRGNELLEPLLRQPSVLRLCHEV
ncbi:MAG TPA: putative quinol monooxygenase [Propionibacteriaceae bacterium]|nr:putative quinol monooxygenase [Propionibacteriaceae bacterium]